MTRLALLSCLAFALLSSVFVVVPAAATPVVDQQSQGTDSASISSRLINQIGQTFTAGVTGRLTRVDVGGIFWTAPGIGSLTVSIFETASGLPTGPALTSQVIPESDVPTGTPGTLFVNFAAAASVVAGSQYAFALVPQTGNLQLRVIDPGAYTRGQTIENGPSSWSTVGGATDPDLMFTTYVDTGASSQTTISSYELSIVPLDGTRCATSSLTARDGTWITLPGASDCIPPASKPSAKLLGWATSPGFPVAIAKRQVDNAWGAYETFNFDGQLTGVFIPAGGSTLVSAAGKLYTIWSE